MRKTVLMHPGDTWILVPQVLTQLSDHVGYYNRMLKRLCVEMFSSIYSGYHPPDSPGAPPLRRVCCSFALGNSCSKPAVAVAMVVQTRWFLAEKVEI